MKKVLNIFKLILLFFLSLISIILFWQSIIYIFSPIYTFLPPEPFRGKNIYNPYQHSDSSFWKKGVFHLHSDAWSFFTDGRKNNKDTILDRYKKLNYNLVSLSDYQKISRLNDTNLSVVSSYEHGINIGKRHHLLLGAEHVSWKDYMFYQDINHKQNMIYTLKDQCKVLAINHPNMMKSFTADDLKKLRGYHLFEALNHLRFSVNLWDTVLSAGIPAFIIANDDCHDIYNPTLFGMCCTFIQSNTNNSDTILNNLKNGAAYGVELAFLSEDINVRAAYHKNVPKLHNIEIIGDTIMRVNTDRRAKTFYFIGQNGLKLDSVFGVSSADYKIRKTDTYIRTEILFDDYTRILLNPVFKYENNAVFTNQNPVNVQATTIKRALYIGLISVFVGIFIILLRRFKKNRRNATI